MSAPALALDEQLTIVARLEIALEQAAGPSERQTVAELLAMLAQRADLFAAVARRIETLRVGRSPEEFPSGPAPVSSAGRIFVSYRHDDAAWPANALTRELTKHLGPDRVFRDVDSIPLGDDFTEAITTAVAACAVLLAVIGDKWLTISDEKGRRRLDDPEDWVRLEIEAALARNVRVVPILIGTVSMPRSDELPAKLAKLAHKQALQLRPDHFESDIDPLLEMLSQALTEASTPPAAAALFAPYPPTAAPGANVTLRGRTLGFAWDSQLTLDGSPIPVTSWSDDAIEFIVPAVSPAGAPWNRSQTVRLAIVNPGQLIGPVPFTISVSPAWIRTLR